jgi:predicted DNA-binding mobile mystery protein A
MKGWLRAVREAVGLTQAQVASRVGVTRQSLAQFENAEAAETVTLSSLRRCAAGIDCDLVYYMVPRASVGSSFAKLAQAHDAAAAHSRATDQTMELGESGHAG